MSWRSRATVIPLALAIVAVLAVVSASSAATKPPIKIMIISTVTGAIAFPETVTGAAAAVQAVNAAGGINGRKIQLVVCDNKFDNNLDAACGRQAVSEKVVALVGGFALLDGHYAVVKDAKIPEIGVYGSTPTAFDYPYYYPISGYTFGGAGGPAAALVDFNKAKKVVNFTAGSTSASANFATATIDAVLKARGLGLQGIVQMPPGTADPTPFVQRAISLGADGFIIGVSAGDADRITRLTKQIAPQIDIARNSATVNQNTIDNLGKALNGVTISSQFLPNTYTENPGVKQWNKEMLAYDTKAVFSDFSANAWAAVHVFVDQAKALKVPLTSASIMKPLNTARVIDTRIGPKVSFRRALPASLLGGATYSRVYNVKITYNAVVGGRIVNTVNGKWYNPFIAPKG